MCHLLVCSDVHKFRRKPYKQMAHGLFSLQFSRFSFSLGGFCQTAEKSCNFHAFPTVGQPDFYDFIALRGPSPVSFVHFHAQIPQGNWAIDERNCAWSP